MQLWSSKLKYHGKSKRRDRNQKNKSRHSTQAADGATFDEKQKDTGIRRQAQHRSAAWKKNGNLQSRVKQDQNLFLIFRKFSFKIFTVLVGRVFREIFCRFFELYEVAVRLKKSHCPAFYFFCLCPRPLLFLPLSRLLLFCLCPALYFFASVPPFTFFASVPPFTFFASVPPFISTLVWFIHSPSIWLNLRRKINRRKNNESIQNLFYQKLLTIIFWKRIIL